MENHKISFLIKKCNIVKALKFDISVHTTELTWTAKIMTNKNTGMRIEYGELYLQIMFTLTM